MDVIQIHAQLWLLQILSQTNEGCYVPYALLNGGWSSWVSVNL